MSCIIINHANNGQEATWKIATLKRSLSGQGQFLASESPLKMTKNAFYFDLKALFVSRYGNFCLDILVM